MAKHENQEERGYRVTGRVQGVGFRWWTRRTATDLGLSGSVCNRPDGSVEVAVKGEVELLDQLERALLMGPPGAAVDHLDRSDSDLHIDTGDFTIVHPRG